MLKDWNWNWGVSAVGIFKGRFMRVRRQRDSIDQDRMLGRTKQCPY
jgi:hypothetical protein